MSRKKHELPPLFVYMEVGEWEKATDRIRRHPREVKSWATLRTKSESATLLNTKRLALHHACFKLRSAGGLPVAPRTAEDPFVQVCRFIIMLVRLYPEAAGQRETRHGCLPLHLACFASCAPRAADEAAPPKPSSPSRFPLPAPTSSSANATAASIKTRQKPSTISKRVASDATTDTNMSAVHAEENYTGIMKDKQVRRSETNPNVSVAAKGHVFISSKREEMAVEVLNALLDAYPKAIRTDSEGGRLPLHTACAGRATPRVIATLITAYPSAARHRNKDGFLPLHLAAHWGVSHPNVVINLLKTYPDATVGRNRWERTPLEEALCMAGENGRPHQSSMVRALRKHPSFWTRATPEILGNVLQQQQRSVRQTIVDIDESLPSSDSTTLENERYMTSGHEQMLLDEEQQHLSPPLPPADMSPPAGGAKGLMARLSPRNKKKAIVATSLEELIRQEQWDTVVDRVTANPLDAETDLQVMTKGGFVSNSGTSPLYYACERQPPVAVIHALIEANPLAVLTRAMPGGALPLHVACTWHASVDVIQTLLTADQGSVKVTDELGNVALHSACFSGAIIPVVQALVNADSHAVLSRNHQGSRPMDILKRLRHENRVECMNLLTHAKETLLRHRRSQSSGTWASVAQEAAELNHAEDIFAAAMIPQPPAASGMPNSNNPLFAEHNPQQQAIEVSYDNDGDELVWI